MPSVISSLRGPLLHRNPMTQIRNRPRIGRMEIRTSMDKEKVDGKSYGFDLAIRKIPSTRKIRDRINSSQKSNDPSNHTPSDDARED